MGGSDTYNTKWRDLGCPLMMVMTMSVWHHWHWSLIPSYGLMFGSLTTYFKKKGTDAKWYNWMLVGLALSMSMLPYAYFTHSWKWFWIRTSILTPAITLWSQLVGNAVVEEVGRGVFNNITLMLGVKTKDV